MFLGEIDPTMSIGFLFKTSVEFEDFCSVVNEINKENRYDSILSVELTAPKDE